MKVASFLWIERKKLSFALRIRRCTRAWLKEIPRNVDDQIEWKKNPFHTHIAVCALCVFLFDFFNKWNGNDTSKQLSALCFTFLAHSLSSRMILVRVCMGQIEFSCVCVCMRSAWMSVSLPKLVILNLCWLQRIIKKNLHELRFIFFFFFGFWLFDHWRRVNPVGIRL